MPTAIKLIVGLGNPGPEYEQTRHNAGAWLVRQLAEDSRANLRRETKFKGLVSSITVQGHECWLLIPSTFMNLSGQAVSAMAGFYKIAPEEILVAHDELDFAAGIVRLKQGGGHGGHNGLRDIAAHLHSSEFHRIRIGIGHPGDRNEVHDYVLSAPSRHDRQQIDQAIAQLLTTLPDLITGHFQKVMRELHIKPDRPLV